MEILKTFKPAEAYFLMQWRPSNEALMMYTLGSLLFDKSLKIQIEKRLPHANAKRASTYKMIKRGDSFEGKNKRDYERKVLDIMGTDVNNSIQLRLFTRAIGAKFSKEGQSFIEDHISRTNVLADFVQNQSFLKRIDQRNSKGKKLGKEIKSYVYEKDLQIESFKQHGKDEKAVELLASLGSFILLLPTLNYDYLKSLKIESLKRFDTYFVGTAFAEDGFTGFASAVDSFEGFGGGDFGGSGASGSFGDSGCSSCSGCSGCGGCGGCS